MTVSHFGDAQRGKDDVSDFSGLENGGNDVLGGGGLSREPDLLEARSVTSPDLELLGNWDKM